MTAESFAAPEPSTDAAPALSIESVSHRFGHVVAVDGVDLEVREGELVCLLGPSGCGKTTLLRLAAGLEQLQDGRIAITGITVAGGVGAHDDVPPERRGVGLMFQDYALFPHLSVLDNVAFGLSRMADDARRERATRLLAQVGMADVAARYPHELSGGQQQRVALARALAPEPRIMLLDEPFSGLDAKLRTQIRDDALHILKTGRSATLMVTHDAEEAMFMADRIAVMCEGRVVQFGRPLELYCQPVNAFVAEFFSDVNRLHAIVENGEVATPFCPVPAGDLPERSPVEILIRPEALKLDWTIEKPDAPNLARIAARRHLGRSTLVHLDMTGVDGAPLHLHSRVPGQVAYTEGEQVAVHLDLSQTFVFPRPDGALTN